MINLINSDYGFYQYKDKTFSLKEDLLDYIIMFCDDEEIEKIPWEGTYNFHDELFSSIDWSIDPPFSISELYRIRAQQLRDEYEYLILSYSGGSDSTQVLNTFMKNNIFIDEIQVYVYEKAMQNISHDLFDKNNEITILLEYEYAAKPILKKFAELNPKTKINIIDCSDYAYDQIVNKKFDYLGNKFHNGHRIITTGYRSHSSYANLYNTHNKKNSKKTAFIRGFDKPKVDINQNNMLYFNFFDFAYSGHKLMRKKLQDQIYVIEDFFLSPKAPLIPIKQSHLILNKMKHDLNFWNLMVAFNKNKTLIWEKYKDEVLAIPITRFQRVVIDPIIYPDWTPLYNGPKIHKNKNPEFELFKHLGYNIQAYEQNKSYTDYLLEKYKKIPMRILDGFMLSKRYYIGNIKYIGIK